MRWITVIGALLFAAALSYGKPSAAPAPIPAPARDASQPHDMAAPSPTHLPRALSDAANYNQLQRTVLEGQRDRLLAELARLEAEHQEINRQLADYHVDTVRGDTWNERTLEIHRRKP